MYSREELEDLSADFEAEHEGELESFEDDMIEAYRKADYDAFMDARKRLKVFCVSAGPGGQFYFDETWKDDPRAARLKMERDGPVYSDVVTMLTERGPSGSKDIYSFVKGANYKALQALVRKGEILRLPESHVYYLPDQDVSGRAPVAQNKEAAIDDLTELTIPSEEEILSGVYSAIEDDLRDRGATEDQIDQVFGRKKKRGFFSLFRRKK